MGPQNRNHTLKISRFRVMDQIRERNGINPKSQITFVGTREWYQSIGLKILHHMSASKKSIRVLRPQSKIEIWEYFQYVPSVTFQ